MHWSHRSYNLDRVESVLSVVRNAKFPTLLKFVNTIFMMEKPIAGWLHTSCVRPWKYSFSTFES